MKRNFYTSKKIINSKISFGFFSKNGGISKLKYNSLNCSYSSDDKKNNVKKNIKIAEKKINLEKRTLKIINQIHSNKVILINKNNLHKMHQGDGIITKDKSISIAVLTADCCPIFIFDDDATFISCLHAGWKGCYLNIVDKAFQKIRKIQPNRNKINALIGPCLHKNNFNVDEKFRLKFVKKNNKYQKYFHVSRQKGKFLFNMRNLIKSQIRENKVKNIENIDLDTYSNPNLFFSHRKSTHNGNNLTGRMINIIGFN